MRRTTLTAAGLLGLAVLAPTAGPTPATAAGETCRGEAATIVGSGARVTGTEGRDVVVTRGASDVTLLGGDDLVCVTGPRRPYVTVDAGAGNDVVDATTSPRQSVFATVGTGADVFLGGDADDRVTVAYPDPATAVPDRVDAGDGSDAIFLTTGPGAAVVDNVAGQLGSAGAVRASWSDVEEFWVDGRESRPLTFVGSGADELLVDRTAVPAQVTLDLGAGDDSYLAAVPPAAGSRLRGGPGRDLVEVASPDADIEIDLKRWRMVVGAATRHLVSTTDFEDATAFAPHVLLRGDNGRNVLGFTACRAVVKGRDGADTVRRTYDGVFETDLGCRESARLDGGPGNDVLSGTRGDDVVNGNDGRDTLRGGRGGDRLRGGRGADALHGQTGADVLLGGPGRDTAHGGAGGDRCVAERERRCER